MIIEGFETKFQQKLREKKEKRERKRKRIISGTGPIGRLVVWIIEEIILKLLVGFYNFFIDLLADGVGFANDIFFSDYKGFFAGKLEEKKGTCFEYTLFRYFLTLLLPPLGVFLSRGISSWYNIILCGLLCFFQYIPGLIYALVVMHTAPYARRYQEHQREKLKKNRPPEESNVEASLTPLIVFIGALCLVGLVVYYNISKNPNQELLIGNPVEMLKEWYNNY